MKQHKSIKIDTELIEKIEQLAKKENRSFNNMVENILLDKFKVCDHLWTTKKSISGGMDCYEAVCAKCGHSPKP